MGTHHQLGDADRIKLGELLRRARGGEVKVLFFLAELYANGAADLQKNQARARTFAHRAARLGHADSQNMLAVMLTREEEMEESFHWFSLAAAGGSWRAQMALYEHYMAGLVVEADMDQALYWFDKAAESNPSPIIHSEVAKLETFVFARVEFTGEYGTVSRVVPMRRRTYWRVGAYETPFFDDMLADLNEFLARHPVVSTEYLEAIRWLKKLRTKWLLSPAVEFVGVHDAGADLGVAELTEGSCEQSL